MPDLRTIKKQGRVALKKHYLLFVVLCAISIFFGTEFTNLTDRVQNTYDILQGRLPKIDVINFGHEQAYSMSRELDDLLNDRINVDREKTAELMATMQEEDNDEVFGRRDGVLAAVINMVASGHLFTTVATAAYMMFRSGKAAVIFLVLSAVLFFGMIWIFARRMYCVILRRAFLEGRVYGRIPLNHLLHIRLVGRWVRTAMTLLYTSVLQLLWGFTIIGGIIKHYSYFLVPFIAAENPDIRAREAVSLSRRMMNGHKWQCFLLDLSYIGWFLLSFLTFGLSDFFWGIPYRMAAYSEYYAALRSIAKGSGMEGAERLNDEWLFARADSSDRDAAYTEIVNYIDILDDDVIEMTPVQSFFARNFGIWLLSIKEKAIYSYQEGLRHRTRVAREEMEGLAYPERMNPLWTKKSSSYNNTVSYLSPCTVWTLVAMFFFFCMFGWVWEVSLHLITNGVIVNRGSLHGPWIPIYGSGVVLISVLLYRLRKKPVLEAFSILVLCGVVEYFTSYFMELFTGMRWWDYTGYFLNLNGRICAEGLAVFAIGGMAAVYLIIPVLDNMILRIRPKLLVTLCSVMLLLFAGDVVYSRIVPNAGEGISNSSAEK